MAPKNTQPSVYFYTYYRICADRLIFDADVCIYTPGRQVRADRKQKAQKAFVGIYVKLS